MQWSDPTNYQGVIQQGYFYAFGDALDHSGDFPLGLVTAFGNIWLSNVGVALWKASKSWSWDDRNQSTLSIATTDLVYNQSDYGLASSILTVQGASVLDVSGNWQRLHPINKDQVEKEGDVDFDFYNETAGMPSEYALYDNSIFLKPPPDNGVSVTLSGGLKLWISRTVTTFSVPASYSTADATIPGFDPSFHVILSLGIAHEYLLANDQEAKAMAYLQKIQAYIHDMQMQFGRRNEDEPDYISARPENYD